MQSPTEAPLPLLRAQSRPVRHNQVQPLSQQSPSDTTPTVADSLRTDSNEVDLESNQGGCNSQPLSSKEIEAVTAAGQVLTMVVDSFLFDMFPGASQIGPGYRLFVEVVGCLRSMYCDQPCVEEHEATRDKYVDNALLVAQGLKLISRVTEAALIYDGQIELSNNDQEIFHWFTVEGLVIDTALFLALLKMKNR